MSRAIYICYRGAPSHAAHDTIQQICERIQPDNIVPRPARVCVEADIAYGIMNPTDMLLTEGQSVLVGRIFGDAGTWHVPRGEFPDGSYALFRNAERYCEVVADPAASRTIWYYFDDSVLVAGTSQRAIIMFLGSFHFDERVVPWMLSSGTMGPSLSWDRRLRRIGPDSSVVLDKGSWSLSHRSLPQEIRPVSRSDAEHKQRLRSAVTNVVSSLGWDPSTWVVLLSGGHDTRGILCCLNEAGLPLDRVKAVTWGSESSPTVSGNDARIALEVAGAFGIPHRYYRNEQSLESIQALVDRFVRMGEARIDHLSGYLDGFNMWRTLFEEGVQVVVRGDQAFGSKLSRSELGVRRHVGWPLLADYPNMEDWCASFATQAVGEEMRRHDGESLQTWSDRLRITYRIPTNLAALSDLKSGYVEQVSPLLSRSILQVVRELPDHLRTNKRFWKEIVGDMSPDVPFAATGANVEVKDILRRGDMLDLLSGTIRSDSARRVFEPDFLQFVREGLERSNRVTGSLGKQPSLKAMLKRLVPRGFAKTIRTNVTGKAMAYDRLAFRVLLSSSARRMFTDDSRAHQPTSEPYAVP